DNTDTIHGELGVIFKVYPFGSFRTAFGSFTKRPSSVWLKATLPIPSISTCFTPICPLAKLFTTATPLSGNSSDTTYRYFSRSVNQKSWDVNAALNPSLSRCSVSVICTVVGPSRSTFHGLDP